ncbi:MAG: hypothetical protein AB1648_01940, partial [Pseudomonadota bacterium]
MYKPIANIVIKADYRGIGSGAGQLPSEFNLGVGFIYRGKTPGLAGGLTKFDKPWSGALSKLGWSSFRHGLPDQSAG